MIISVGLPHTFLSVSERSRLRAFTAQANWQCSGEQRPLFFFPLVKHVFSGTDGGGQTNLPQLTWEGCHLLQAQGKLGSVRHPLTLHLWVLGQAGTSLGISTNVTSSAALGRDGHAAGHLGEKACAGLNLGPFLPSDAGDMIEMQGFGPSLTAWHLEPLCSQGSSCLSCPSSSSPYAPPSHCSCTPDR